MCLCEREREREICVVMIDTFQLGVAIYKCMCTSFYATYTLKQCTSGRFQHVEFEQTRPCALGNSWSVQ